MSKMNRREFLGTTIAATGVCVAGSAIVKSGLSSGVVPENGPTLVIDHSVKSPTDRVRLGRSGLKVSMVGIGTGTIGYAHSSNQTRLGQEEFTRLIRHSLDQGINFFDLADAYGSHALFSKAMKGVPRDRYIIQTKTDNRDPQGARDDIARFLTELETTYIDSLIIHCVTAPDWTTRYRGVMDVLEEAKQQGKIRVCGVTCHSFEALQAAEASDWVQINQVRWNPRRAHMDADVETVRALFSKMRGKGQGMIGMKVVGQGDLVNGDRPASPAECFRFQVESGVVDAFVVGVEKTEHVDQLIAGTQVALKELGYRALLTA
jgi:aryl-alcohol dehydrogenase-like predicted oxidoreductase